MTLKLSGVLNSDQVAEVRRIVESAKFIDGSISGNPALKQNVQAERNTPEFDKAIQMVVSALMAHPEFRRYAIPKQITLEFNRYDPGMYYETHMDAAVMGGVRAQPMRADLSFTVFLTDPESFRGGDFVMQTPYGEERIREAAGNAIVYPANMLHRVEAIEEGTRWAAVGWIQSMVRREDQRQIVYEIDRIRDRVAEALPDSDLRERLSRVYSNLLRTWAET